MAALEYRQHLARAACGSGADRRDELLAAVSSARRAVELYRDAFDYHSMVVMQFDVAVARHRLGEQAAALAALGTALNMDRAYGFADDARENYKVLLTWRGAPAGAAQVAGFMRSFPKRRVLLKFGWHAIDARITLKRHRAYLQDGRIFDSRARAAFERHIAARHVGGWSVSYTHRLERYEPGIWPSEHSAQAAQVSFPPAPFPAVDFTVSRTGKFEGVTDPKGFSARLTARTDNLIRAGVLSGAHAQSAVKEAIENTADFLAPGMLEAETIQNYQLETAMWIGAALDQGVWYAFSAPLSLPGMPRLIVQQRLEFAFTRRVPCRAESAVRTCAEIVIHATPDEAALKHVLADVGTPFPNTRWVDFDASSTARIVVDPATLLPYSLEKQIHWYASIGQGKGRSILESEHLLVTTTYADDRRAIPGNASGCPRHGDRHPSRRDLIRQVPPAHHGKVCVREDPR